MAQKQGWLSQKAPLALLLILCLSAACGYLFKRKSADAQGPKRFWKQERPLCEGKILGVWGPVLGRALFAYGEFGALLRSDDRGATWRRLDTGTNRDLYSLFGSLSGNFVVGAEGTALSSQDDGETWEPMEVGDVKALRAVTGALRTSPTSNIEESARLPERLFIVGDEGLVLISEDGKTWRRVYSGTTWNLHAVFSSDGQSAYASGEGGTLIHSKDGGQHWEEIPLNTRETLRSIWSSPSQEVYVAGDHLVLRSDEEDKFTLLGFTGVTRVYGNGSDVYIADDQKLWRSSDRGLRWSENEQLNDITSDPITSIWSRGPDEVYFLTSQGALYASSQNDAGWDLRYFHVLDTLYGVLGTELGVFLVGEHGLVLREEKGAWQPWGDPFLTAKLFNVWQAPGEIFFAVGESGIYQRHFTGDEGWEPSLHVDGSLFGVSGSPLVGVVAVGKDGLVVRSSDAGATWEALPIEPTFRADLNTVTVTGDGTIYAGGVDAMLLRSKDNGKSFERLWLPKEENFDIEEFFSMWSDPDGTLWIAGWGRSYEVNLKGTPEAVVWKLPRGDAKSAEMTVLERGSRARSLWRSSDGVLYVAARRGVYSTRNGERWRLEVDSKGAVFYAIGGFEDQAFAVGGDGLIWSLR